MMKKLLFAAFCAMSVIGLTACGDDDRAYTNGQSKEYLKTDEQRKEIELAKEYLKTADMEYPTPKTAEMACIVGDLDVLKKMEENGFRLWNNPELIGNAVYFGRIDCCKYLLSKGVDANALFGVTTDYDKATKKIFLRRNKESKLPILTIAAFNGNLELCKYLVAHGADVNARGGIFGYSVLHYAALNGNVEVCKYLVSQGADVNARTEYDGYSVLHYAALSGNVEVCKYLVSLGADVNARTKYDGYSVLHYAALSGNVELCKYLMSQGADVNAMNKDGETALDIAKKKGHTAVVEYLESIGAK